MNKAILAGLLSVLAVPAFAESRVTVEQLNREIASSHEKRDTKVADHLSGLELTERLSAAKLAALEKALPGPASRRALVLLADRAVFLDPPPSEIPNQPAPSFEQQRAIIAKTVDYVTSMVHQLPNLFAKRDTIHFEDTPPGPRLGTSSSYNAAQPLHPVSRTPVTVLYRDGQDYVMAGGKEEPSTTLTSTGLSSFGEFGSILSTVLIDLPKGNLAWKHWEMHASKLVAVFSFAVPKASSHYAVRYCCVGRIPFQQFSAYRGEIAIDPQSGTILSLTLLASLAKEDPVTQADLKVEYGPVELGGKTYFCPTKSVSLSLAADQSLFRGAKSSSINGMVMVAAPQDLAEVPRQTMLNETVFDHYHLFHSDSRILTGADSEPAPADVAAATVPTEPAESSAENTAQQLPPANENAAPAASTAGEVTSAGERASAVPNSAVPTPIATKPAAPSTPEISFVAPSELPLAPTAPASTAEPGFSLRVSTHLVNIGVKAYDKKGKPVADLKREDFVVSDDGKKQQIRSFSHTCTESVVPPPSAVEIQPDFYSNRIDATGGAQLSGACSPESLTTIFLDTTGMGSGDITRIRGQMIKFLEGLPPSEHLGLYVRSGVGFTVLAEGSADHTALVSALRNWMPNDEDQATVGKKAESNWRLAQSAQTSNDMNYMTGAVGGDPHGTQNVFSVWEIQGGGEAAHVDPISMREASNRTRQSLAALGSVAAHLGGTPGHKNLIWIAGENVLADWSDQPASSGPNSLENVAMRTQDALNDARVSLYPLDSSQMEAPAIDTKELNDSVKVNSTVLDKNPSGSLEETSTLAGARSNADLRLNSHSVRGAFKQMAEATGGRSFNRSENMTASFTRVIEDGAATYFISFTPETQPDDQFHRLKVDLPARRGTTLQYRAGYLYSKGPTTLKDRFREAIWQPLDTAEIGVRASRSAASSGATISLNIATADVGLAQEGDRRTGKLDVFLVHRDQAGGRADVSEQTLAFNLGPATYEKVLREGIPFEQYFNNQQNSETMRIIVVDENSGRIGSVTLPAAAGSTNP